MSPSEAASEATDLAELRAAAAQCTGCDLYKGATQTVFGAGPDDARLLFVGEQPGDTEDREGEPFVGPAGKLLDRALDDAAIVREDAYVTNLVKHFKFTRRGKRRIHQRPDSTQIAACRPWLDKEIALIEPDVVVALGATAAKALLGSSFRVTKSVGRSLSETRRATAPPCTRRRSCDSMTRSGAQPTLTSSRTCRGSPSSCTAERIRAAPHRGLPCRPSCSRSFTCWPGPCPSASSCRRCWQVRAGSRGPA